MVKEGIIKHAGFFQLQLWFTVIEFFHIFPSGRDRTVEEGIIKHAGFFQLQL
jgi:hypothetical protein